METKFVNDDDKRQYADFLRHHLTSIASRRAAVPLHHYTTGHTLIRIIESGQLWATQIGCLNDAKELTHAVDLLRDAIAKKLLSGVDADFRALLAKIDEMLSDPAPERAPPFVICFSGQADDLSQWRAYGGAEGGYAIEFDHKTLGQFALKKYGAFLVPVLYSDDDKQILIQDIVKWTETFYRAGLLAKRAPTRDEWIEEFSRFWLWNLSFFAPMTKHRAFEAEAEWRLIHWFRAEDVPNVKVLQRPSMMTRHLPLSFGDKDANNYSPLPIVSVMVGPTAHPEISKIGVGDLLKSKGYAAADDVKVTKVPFRTMR